ncbi:MAG: amidohydrolase family protein [Thermogutta sp.]|nr:amidohydrolase family protein [Thermogutta sp.]
MSDRDVPNSRSAAPSAESLRIQAEWVLPIHGPPLHWGCVRIRAGRIEAVEPGTQPRPEPDPSRITLRGTVLMPGLINAHCHLELSGWNRPRAARQEFRHWVPEVVAFRRSSEYRPDEAVRAGLAESLRHGIVWIGDIVPAALLDRSSGGDGEDGGSPPQGPRPGVTAFLEIVAPLGKEPREIAALVESHLKLCEARGWRPGLSPHAPYTIPLAVLGEIAGWCRRHELPLAIHLGETAEERRLLQRGDGPLREMLERLSAFDPRQFPGGADWCDYLARLSDVPRLLVIHGNHLDTAAIRRLAGMGNATVVYCPRTHRRFTDATYPMALYREAGIPVAVGTDSRATAPDLSLWRELGAAGAGLPGLSPKDLLEMVTAIPARALGVDGEIGTLEPGKRADLTAVAVSQNSDDPYAALLGPEATVSRVWLAGQPVVAQGEA